jgi:hypothetical protein
MTDWVERQFAEGLDKPAITIDVDMVDISNTSDYADYKDLERICLGDKVKCYGNHGIEIEARVVGLTYDLIRGYNTKVTIGQLGKSLSQILKVSYQGTSDGQKLVAGDNVVIDGKVISVEDNTGAVAGLKDATLEGVSIVHGNVARLNDIYRELTQAQYNNLSSQEKNSGKLFYITDTQTIMHKNVAYGGGGNISYGTSTPTGGSDEDVYFQTDSNGNIVKIWQNHSGVWSGMTGGGLEYFIESENALYGINGDAQYMREDPKFRHTAPAVFTSYLQRNSTSGYAVHTCPNVDYNDIVGIRGSQFAPLFGRTAGDGIFIISKDPTHCYFTVEEWSGTYPQTGAPNYSDSYSYSSTHNVKTQLNVTHKSNSGAISDTFTFNGETYYIVIDGQSWDWWTLVTEIETEYKWFYGEWNYPSVQGYYQTVGAYGLAIMQANIGSQKYNGISRADGLAFFAGADDEDGTNAPIKIFDNGTAEGLATTADLALKQDKLIAGDNISIGSDGKTVNAKVYANPTDTATEAMTKLTVGDTTYEIQGGGGGGSNLILDAQRYSLEEQVVGIWTDGKPLYQCTEHIILSNPIEPSTETSVTLSSFSNAEKVFNISVLGGYKGSDSVVSKWVAFMEQSYIHTASDRVITNWNKTLMRVQTGSNYANFPSAGVDNRFREFYVTIQYTKTTDTAGSGGYQAYGFSPIIYSDVEREVGVWRDNKPLYAKTVTTGGSVPSGATLIHREALEGYDCICYTKLADVAGSGEYNTLAVPNVHYSTDEQVIGTWIDGKTLYQKTVTTGGRVPTGATLIEREVMESYDTIKYTKA